MERELAPSIKAAMKGKLSDDVKFNIGLQVAIRSQHQATRLKSGAMGKYHLQQERGMHAKSNPKRISVKQLVGLGVVTQKFYTVYLDVNRKAEADYQVLLDMVEASPISNPEPETVVLAEKLGVDITTRKAAVPYTWKCHTCKAPVSGVTFKAHLDESPGCRKEYIKTQPEGMHR